MRGATGLVVGDDQLAVVVELEPVDDAAQREVADRRLEPQLEPDRPHAARIFERHVVGGELAALGEEPLGGFASSSSSVKSGWTRVLGDRSVDAAVERVRRALGGREQEQQLERAVHQRALGGGLAWAGRGGVWMLAKRNASGHDRNDSTLDGERLVGSVHRGGAGSVAAAMLISLRHGT